MTFLAVAKCCSVEPFNFRRRLGRMTQQGTRSGPKSGGRSLMRNKVQYRFWLRIGAIHAIMAGDAGGGDVDLTPGLFQLYFQNEISFK